MSLRVATLSFASLALITSLSAQTARLASRGLDGSPGNDESYSPALSADGRYLAFYSDASNLVARDTNGEGDIFVFDRVTKSRFLASVSALGGPANGESHYPSLSADGRFLVFHSLASNLVPGDTNGVSDVFLRDLATGKTERISLSSAGLQGNSSSYNADVSDDGRYVVFDSHATNLVAGDTNGRSDVFRHDRLNGLTERVDVGLGGVQADRGAEFPYLSADGNRVVFQSASTNLVAGDTNGAFDMFVVDFLNATTTRVNVDSSGNQANYSAAYVTMSADGRWFLFGSIATNLVVGDTPNTMDLFLHDSLTGATVLAGVDSNGVKANDYTARGTLSADGRYVAFRSTATNLAPGDTHGQMNVYLRDLWLGITSRISVGVDGQAPDGPSSQPLITDDGRTMAFYSEATNLVRDDTNGVWDVFVSDLRNVRAR
jgi:Tol biopolymer transport system component